MSKFDLNAYKEQNPSQVAVVELAVIEQKDHNGHRLPDAHIVAEDVVDHQGNIIAKKGKWFNISILQQIMKLMVKKCW